MDRPSEVKVWEPEESGTLEGVFHLEGGLNWMIQTKDGALWLLASDAEAQLQTLAPFEGQAVHVLHLVEGHGSPVYRVTLR